MDMVPQSATINKAPVLTKMRLKMVKKKRTKKGIPRDSLYLYGAGNGIRTRDLQLGKLTLYH